MTATIRIICCLKNSEIFGSSLTILQHKTDKNIRKNNKKNQNKKTKISYKFCNNRTYKQFAYNNIIVAEIEI